MAVREFDGVDDFIVLGGSGAGLTNRGLIIVVRPLVLTGTRCYIAACAAASTMTGLYYDAANEVSYASNDGDTNTTTFTVNTTDWWALGVTKATGASLPRFHAKNITTGAAASHAGGGTTRLDDAGNWTATRISTFSDATGDANMRVATAAVFTSVYSDADFNTVVSSTAQILALSPSRAWDFNQASVATDVNNLLTDTDDQTAITGTTVVAGDDPPGWTFSAAAAAAPGPSRSFTPIPFM